MIKVLILSNKKLLFIVNVDWFFISHRLPIALAAIEKGYEVHIVTGITNKQDELISKGLIVHPIPINRSKANLLNEAHTFIHIYRFLKSIKPDVVHLVTIKPVIYGGIAARLAGIKNVVVAISGLGHIFSEQGIKAKIRRSLVSLAYKVALGQKHLKVVFQNPTDRDTLAKITKLSPNQKIMIPGSGVDLSVYNDKSTFTKPYIVILAARLLHDKGIGEFVTVASLLREKGFSARFCLIGEPDPSNPNSVTEKELSRWKEEGVVECWGYRSDMPTVLSNSYMVVLPSYYGEGLPKVLIEAAACGKAVITTDMPGCRDAIIPNETGILIPPRNIEALAESIELLLVEKNLCEKMGKAGRELAERTFSIEKVVDTHLNIYNELIKTAT